MDTGTHVVMGIALGGIATLDPVVGSDPAMAHAVMIATLAGSQAPDIDTVLKLEKQCCLYKESQRIYPFNSRRFVLVCHHPGDSDLFYPRGRFSAPVAVDTAGSRSACLC